MNPDLAPPAVCASDGASAPADRRTAPRAGRRSANLPRECDCPAQIHMCRHFDGSRLMISYTSVVCHSSFAEVLLMPDRAPDVTFPCCGILGWLEAADDARTIYLGLSDADALAAFYAAEEALLRGGDA